VGILPQFRPFSTAPMKLGHAQARYFDKFQALTPQINAWVSPSGDCLDLTHSARHIRHQSLTPDGFSHRQAGGNHASRATPPQRKNISTAGIST